MSSSQAVEFAHRYSRKRAILWVMLGATSLLLAALNLSRLWVGDGLDPDHLDFWGRRAAWVVATGLAVAVLATGGGLRLSRRVRALMNDEITLQNRARALSVGFWTVMALGLALATLDSFHLLVAGRAIMTLVSSALGVSLITFGVLELRADA
jgi:hypothetical protein